MQHFLNYLVRINLYATETFKTKNELNPKIMEEIFTFKNVDHNLRINTSLKIGNLRTVSYGTESLTNLGAKIRNLLPNEYKELKSLSTFEFQTTLLMNALVECAKIMLQTWFYLIINN